MKVLIPILIGLLVVGCGSRESSLVGYYITNDLKKELYLRSDNVAELQKELTGDWKIEDGELVIEWMLDEGVMYFSIEENGDLLWVAVKDKETGKRIHLPESEYMRFYRQREKDKEKDK